MGKYTGKIALVTGSRRGVGRIIADHFLREDAAVIGLAKGESTIEHSAYSHIRVDVADPAAITAAFSSIRKNTTAIDIVVNNAAVLTSQYALLMPPAAAQAMVNTNLLAPFLISREAAKMMLKTKWGRIINIGSMAASLEPVGDSMYAATKAGLSTLANVMAKEFGAFNVTCNTLAITAIETDMLSKLPREKIDEIVAKLPLPRFAQPDDILNVVDFLASDRSSYVTAQTIFLGGVN
jgi:3-oxoacyl-[acyl-carrier protein] reductase